MKKRPTILIVFVFTIIFFSYLKFIKLEHSEISMPKSKSRRIAKSSINVGVLIGTDKSGFTRLAKSLYYSDDLILRGFGKIPSSLVTTPDFEPDRLPETYRSNISQLRSISFKQGFTTGRVFTEGTFRLQAWLSKQKKLKHIDLRFFSISDLTLIKNLPIEYLLLSSVSITNRRQVVQDICDMKHLKFLVQDNLFTTEEKGQLQVHLTSLSVISFRDYTMMLLEKKLDIDNL